MKAPHLWEFFQLLLSSYNYEKMTRLLKKQIEQNTQNYDIVVLYYVQKNAHGTKDFS